MRTTRGRWLRTRQRFPTTLNSITPTPYIETSNIGFSRPTGLGLCITTIADDGELWTWCSSRPVVHLYIPCTTTAYNHCYSYGQWCYPSNGMRVGQLASICPPSCAGLTLFASASSGARFLFFQCFPLFSPLLPTLLCSIVYGVACACPFGDLLLFLMVNESGLGRADPSSIYHHRLNFSSCFMTTSHSFTLVSPLPQSIMPCCFIAALAIPLLWRLSHNLYRTRTPRIYFTALPLPSAILTIFYIFYRRSPRTLRILLFSPF